MLTEAVTKAAVAGADYRERCRATTSYAPPQAGGRVDLKRMVETIAQLSEAFGIPSIPARTIQEP